jgi:polyphosphate kinase 2 (PPK2 family)
MPDKLDLSLKMGSREADKAVSELQLKLIRLQLKMRQSGVPVIVMYEGCDASGKGGSILRITEKLDPRGFHVWPIGAPDAIEKAHHYLWRFWTRLPAKGELVIFDRSWYGRVLVERIEGFCTTDEWKRAYKEIREFERQITDDGAILVKFWLQISKDEQLRRFHEREKDPYKQWKITPDDWRDREKWDKYAKAAEDMFKETNTDFAPWHLIPAESKPYARVQTLHTVVKSLEKVLGDVSLKAPKS